jgi:hypothetical protein
MNEALLPALDAPGLLREVAFGLLLRDRLPIDVASLAEAAHMPHESVASAVASLARGGWLDLDSEGRIAGSAGLSLSTGPHGLTVGEHAFRTWCAYDALGIAAALRAQARVDTTCGECGRPITVSFRDGEPDRSGPERLWLATRGADLRGGFCTPTVLLCGDVHGLAWSDAQAGRGELLDLAEGARIGGEAWAGCASTAREIVLA